MIARRSSWSWHVIAAMAFLVGCDVPSDEIEIVEADRRQFEDEVYPILLADCGFPDCHGNPDRFFAVFGPGRTRLSDEAFIYDPPTAQELDLSYARARSMLSSPDGPRRSPLLRKPLAVSAGGQEHAGDDPWGGSIYETKRDPRYETLFFWAISGEGGSAP